MSNRRNHSLAILSATAFANAAPAADAGKRKAGAPKAADRVDPEFTAPRADVKMPEGGKRGSKGIYAEKFESLTEVGMSFGLTNKTKAQLSTVVSKFNTAADNQRQKLDANGQPVTKQGEPVKDASGAVIGHGQPVPVMEKVKEFQAFDVNPKTDPDKATVRVFRVK